MKAGREDPALVARLIALHAQVLDSSLSVAERLVHLWEVGDKLRAAKVAHPHSFGAEMQLKTNGAVSRAVLFRGAKARQLFVSKEAIVKDLGKIRSVQYFYDLLSLIDDSKQQIIKLNAKERAALFEAAATLNSVAFRKFLQTFKSRVAPGILGKDVRTRSGFEAMGALADAARALDAKLELAVQDPDALKVLRNAVPAEEFESLANMSIALAGPSNLRLYRKCGPEKSSALSADFALVYDGFKKLFRSRDDRARARLRRHVSGSLFEGLATKAAAVGNDVLLDAYKRDRKFVIRIESANKKA